MDDLETLRKALTLIGAIRGALSRGCVHRNKAGVILRTELEILECLKTELGVEVEDPPSSER